jgi:hypothetical protein
LIKDALFKHGDNVTLKACVKSLAFAATESHADLQDSAQQSLKETVDELASKLKSAMAQAGVSPVCAISPGSYILKIVCFDYYKYQE